MKTSSQVFALLALLAPFSAFAGGSAPECVNLTGNWKGSGMIANQQQSMNLEVAQSGCQAFRIPHFSTSWIRTGSDNSEVHRYSSQGENFEMRQTTSPSWKSDDRGAIYLNVVQHVSSTNLSRNQPAGGADLTASLKLTDENHLQLDEQTTEKTSGAAIENHCTLAR